MGHGRHHWVVSYWEDIIAEGDVDKEHIRSISPVNFAANVNVPVLLIHGTRDNVVKIKQSEEMVYELEDEDKNVTFVELKKGDHYLSDAQNRMLALKAVDSFLKQHL